MPSQTPMTGSNCDLGNAMIKTKTLRYNHKKEGVSKAQKRPQYKSKLATLVKYT